VSSYIKPNRWANF